MRRISAWAATALAAVLVAPSSGAAAPYRDYDARTGPPVAGDCGRIVAALGQDRTWYGEFSGRRYDTFTDRYYPYGASGCFESEGACRLWHQQGLTYLGVGPLNYMTCRRGDRR